MKYFELFNRVVRIAAIFGFIYYMNREAPDLKNGIWMVMIMCACGISIDAIKEKKS